MVKLNNFETSADSATWTPIWAVAADFNLETVYLRMWAGTFWGGGTNPGTAGFDNVRLTPDIGPLSNLALNRPATQSSSYTGTPVGVAAGLAVDGNTNGDHANGSVTHTNSENQPWWQVDLGRVQSIQNIKVWNRTDCCPERLSNYYVFVSDQPFQSNNVNTTRNQAGVSSYYVSGQGQFPTQTEVNRAGRYVRVQLTGTNHLSLAEVQVWGNNLSDDFNDNSLNTSKWFVTDPANPTTVREQNQRLEVSPQPNTYGYNYLSSVQAHDFTGQITQVEVVQVSTQHWTETVFKLKLDDNNYFHMSAGAGRFVCDVHTAGVQTRLADVGFYDITRRYWRFRHNSESNTVSFQTSADGVTWTTVALTAVTFPVDALKVVLGAGAYGNIQPNPGTAIFDNLKFEPAAPNVGPAVSVTGPANLSTFIAPAAVTIAVNASDAEDGIHKVEFFQNGAWLGEDYVAPYSFDWANVGPGAYALTARATDGRGMTSTSAPVNITVNQRIAAPTSLSLAPVSPAQINLSWADNSANENGFQIERKTGAGGAWAALTTVGANVTSFQNTGLAPNTIYYYRVRGTSSNSALNSDYSDEMGARTLNTAPLVTLTAPAANATFTAPATINFTASASDPDANGGIVRVDYYEGAALLCSGTVAPSFSCSKANMPEGIYLLTARAVDNSGAGNSTTTSAAVTVRVGAPNQAPTAHAGGPYNAVVGQALAFNGGTSSDSDGTITSYNWNFGDGTVGTGATPTHAYAAAGTYTATLTVTDDDNAEATATTTVTITTGVTPVPTDGWSSLSYDPATNKINTAGYEYDHAGNQTRAQSPTGVWQRYAYDAAGRLVKVKNDANVTINTQTYGATNQRLISQDGGDNSNNRTYYAWVGGVVIAEYWETDVSPTTPTWGKNYVYLSGRLLATQESNGIGGEFVSYYHPDRLGTRLITNASNTSVSEQVTLPFGTALSAESTGMTSRRFTSYDRSIVSGLDYALNRHYDSQQGRFTTVDPLGVEASSLDDPQTLNMYSYVGNDPINRIDPEGLFFGKLLRVFSKVLKIVAIAAVIALMVVSSPIAPAAGTVLAKVLSIIITTAAKVGLTANFISGGALIGVEAGAAAATTVAAATVGTGTLLGVSVGVGAIASNFQNSRQRRQMRRQAERRAKAAADAARRAVKTIEDMIERSKAPTEGTTARTGQPNTRNPVGDELGARTRKARESTEPDIKLPKNPTNFQRFLFVLGKVLDALKGLNSVVDPAAAARIACGEDPNSESCRRLIIFIPLEERCRFVVCVGAE